MGTQKKFNPKLFFDERAKRAGLDFEAAVCLDNPIDNKIIDRIQKRLLRRAFRRISQKVDLAGKKILDFGCGTGRWVEFFRSYGMEYTGVDLSTEMIRIASGRFPDAIFAALSAEGIPHPSHVFDIVCSIAVVHHNPYEEQSTILHDMIRTIKPGGFLVLFEGIRSLTPESVVEFPRSCVDWDASLRTMGLELLWIEGTRYFSTRIIMNRLIGKKRFHSMVNKISIYLDPYLGGFLPLSLQSRVTMVYQKIVEK